MDYTTGKVYLYIPSFQILSSGTFSHNETLKRIELSASMTPFNPQIAAKYDNIRISAIKTLPPYLGIDDFVSSKFNVFPNPINDVVTVTNNENIGMEEIIIYDIIGKRIKTKKYNDKNEIQLNLSDLSSGTYLLHIKTKDDIAIKKVIKK
jgi:hypothetical protein